MIKKSISGLEKINKYNNKARRYADKNKIITENVSLKDENSSILILVSKMNSNKIQATLLVLSIKCFELNT